jgi:hypothetical protein
MIGPPKVQACSPLQAKSTLTVAAAMLIAWSSSAFCGENVSSDLCEPKQAEVEKLKQWVTYDSAAKTANLETNLAKLAAANESLQKCLESLVPIWREDEIEIMKLYSQQPDLHVDEFETTYNGNEKVPYFNGSGALTYTFYATEFLSRPLISVPAASEWGSGVLIYRFPSFLNYFVYSDDGAPFRSSGIPHGARTYAMGRFPVDQPNTELLAEARLVSSRNGRSPFELEEFHYDRHGKLLFHCISKINNLGAKVQETKSWGRKENEFYFVWPVRLVQ